MFGSGREREERPYRASVQTWNANRDYKSPKLQYFAVNRAYSAKTRKGKIVLSFFSFPHITLSLLSSFFGSGDYTSFEKGRSRSWLTKPRRLSLFLKFFTDSSDSFRFFLPLCSPLRTSPPSIMSSYSKEDQVPTTTTSSRSEGKASRRNISLIKSKRKGSLLKNRRRTSTSKNSEKTLRSGSLKEDGKHGL